MIPDDEGRMFPLSALANLRWMLPIVVLFWTAFFGTIYLVLE